MPWQGIGDTSADKVEKGLKRHHFPAGKGAGDAQRGPIH